MVGEPLLVILPSRSMPAYASEAHLFGNLLNDLLQDELCGSLPTKLAALNSMLPGKSLEMFRLHYCS